MPRWAIASCPRRLTGVDHANQAAKQQADSYQAAKASGYPVRGNHLALGLLDHGDGWIEQDVGLLIFRSYGAGQLVLCQDRWFGAGVQHQSITRNAPTTQMMARLRRRVT